MTTNLARALLAVCLLAVVGCGGDDDDDRSAAPPPAATASPQTTPAPDPAPTETADSLSGAGIEPVTVAATNTDTALLTAVRAAAHDGYDRVVFEFSNEVPGYDVRYVGRPVRQDGSGNEVEVEGEFVVGVRMENALDADLSKPSAPRTYEGPNRFSPETPQVVELVRSGGFEGVLTWVVGLRDQADFRVATLQRPPRLVIDFRAGPTQTP